MPVNDLLRQLDCGNDLLWQLDCGNDILGQLDSGSDLQGQLDRGGSMRLKPLGSPERPALRGQSAPNEQRLDPGIPAPELPVRLERILAATDAQQQ